MGLYYPLTSTFPLIGTKTAANVRTAVTLTAAYDAATTTKTFETTGMSKVNLDIFYTMGATETANTVDIRVDESPDGTNFYRIPNESVSAGTSTLTAREFTFLGADAAAATISIGLDVFYRYVRVSVKESGKATNFGTVYVEGNILGK